MPPTDLDPILTLQLHVAAYGETLTPPWWHSDLAEAHDSGLLTDLFPTTAPWVRYQLARELARRTERRAFAAHGDPDQLIGLFSLGLDLDEKLNERLRDLKRASLPPEQALPTLTNPLGPAPTWSDTPVGRRLSGPPPATPLALAQALAAATLPPPAHGGYPAPHFLLRRPA